MINKLPFISSLNQSCEHNKAWTVLASKRLRYSSITLPPVLKALSDATVVAGIAKMSRANKERIGYRPAFTFHHAKISNLSLESFSTGSSKYKSKSDFLG